MHRPAAGEYKCKCGKRFIIEYVGGDSVKGKMITKHELPSCAAYDRLIAEGGNKVSPIGIEYIPPRR